RLLRVHDQIQQDLLELVRVTPDLGQVRRQVEHDLDPVAALVVDPEGQRAVDDVGQRDLPTRRFAPAGEAEQVADDLAGAPRLAADRLDHLAAVRVQVAAQQELGEVADRPQRVVQLVRHAGDQPTHQGEPVRLHDPRL